MPDHVSKPSADRRSWARASGLGLECTGIAVARQVGMAKKKRPAGKRDTVRTKNATFYAKRTARGPFKEMDEEGRPVACGVDTPLLMRCRFTDQAVAQ